MPADAKITPMPPGKVLDLYALEVRCKLLEIAAILDRHDRGRQAHPDAAADDPRLRRFRQSLAVLSEADAEPNRAEQIALIFSGSD